MKRLWLAVLMLLSVTVKAWANPYPAIYVIASDLTQHAKPPFTLSSSACNLLYLIPWHSPGNGIVGAEESEGVFTWSDVTTAVASFKATCPQGKWALGVVAGSHTPQWVYNAGAASFTSISGETVPIPWDSIFLSKWSALVTAAHAQFGSDPAFDHADLIGWANYHFPSSTLPVNSSTSGISSITESGTTATLNIPQSSSITFGTLVNAGDSITISGNSVSGYNGTWTVATASAKGTSLTFTAGSSGLGTGKNGNVCDTTLSATCATDTSNWAANTGYTTVPLMTNAEIAFGTAATSLFPWVTIAPQPLGFPVVTGCGISDCSSTGQRAQYIATAGTNFPNSWIFEADSLTATSADPALPQAKAVYPNIRLIYQESTPLGTGVNAAIALAQGNGAYIVEIYPGDVQYLTAPANGQGIRWPRFHQ